MADNPAETAKRQMLTMRVTQRMKDRIAAVADSNGRSVSQEIEMRLERTFYQDDELGDREQAGFLRWLATIMDAATRQGRQSWLEDPEIFAYVRSAAQVLFDAYQPPDTHVPVLEQLSPGGRAEVERWEADAKERTAASVPHVRRATELHMKKELRGLTQEEEDEMEQAFEAANIKPTQLKLDDADMRIWQEHGRRRQLMKRVETAVVDLILAIRAARASGSGAEVHEAD